MHIIITILLVIAGIVALLLIIGVFTKKEYHVQREIIINAPVQKVFDYIKLVRNQDNYNKWLMVDLAMKRESKGIDGTVGFIYSWAGNKQGGPGEQEIMVLVEGKRVEMEVRFIDAFAGISPYLTFTTESVSEHQTKVTWSNASKMKYPVNIMLPLINVMLAKDLDISLNNLKIILEK